MSHPGLRRFDVFALPSYADEGVPQALVQAMYVGAPCVTTNAGAIGEVAIADHTAIVVAKPECDRARCGIDRLLSDSALASRLVAAARARVKDEIQSGVDARSDGNRISSRDRRTLAQTRMARATEPSRLAGRTRVVLRAAGRRATTRPTPRATRSTRILIAHHLLLGDTLDADAAARETSRAPSAQRRGHGRPRTVCAAVRARCLTAFARSGGIRALPRGRRSGTSPDSISRSCPETIASAGSRWRSAAGGSWRSAAIGPRERAGQSTNSATIQRHPPHGPTSSRRSSTARRPRRIAGATGPILLPHPSTCRRAPMRCCTWAPARPSSCGIRRRWRALAASIEARGLEPVWSAGRGEDAIVRECAGDTRYRSYAAALSLSAVVASGGERVVAGRAGHRHRALGPHRRDADGGALRPRLSNHQRCRRLLARRALSHRSR